MGPVARDGGTQDAEELEERYRDEHGGTEGTE
jgi:hypothetical protein